MMPSSRIFLPSLISSIDISLLSIVKHDHLVQPRPQVSERDGLQTMDDANGLCSKVSGQFHSVKGSMVESVRCLCRTREDLTFF